MPGHGRVADAIVLATLKGGLQGHHAGFGLAAAQSQRYFDLVEIDHHIAKVLILVGRCWRPLGRGDLGHVGIEQAELVAFLVQVIARSRGEAQQ